MRFTFIFLIFLAPLFRVDAQEIESAYYFKKEKTFSNIYRNYSETDSLILFKNKTFRKSHSYFGFDEFEKKVFEGNWQKDKNLLTLNVDKKRDSLKLHAVTPFTVTYRFKTKFLKPTDKNERKLKRIN